MPNQHVIPFTFESANIRVMTLNNEPWFIAQDICNALKISNSRDALLKLDHDEKDVVLTDTLGGKQNINVISESGMYFLVMRCRGAIRQGTLPHRFRKWVTSEVLPSIRKTGIYTSQTTYTPPSSAEAEAYYMNELYRLFNVIRSELEPISSVKISGHFIECGFLISSFRGLLNAKLLPGEIPRIN